MKKPISYLAFIVPCIFCFFAIYIRSQPSKVENFSYFSDDQFQIIAHRGGLGLKPENTMLAFRNADSLNVDVLEMDVRRSKDGKLIVIHDETVDRTTNGTGLVNKKTVKQLQLLDAGFHWQNNLGDFPYRNKGVRIPLLSEILEEFGHRRLLIEIKSNDELTSIELCHTLQLYGMEKNTVVGSFYNKSLNIFSEHCPNTPKSASSIEVATFLFFHYLRLELLYTNPPSAFQVPEYLGKIHLVDSRFIRQIQDMNSAVHVWTVNQPERMQRLIDVGVNGIITDYPERLNELLKRKKEPKAL